MLRLSLKTLQNESKKSNTLKLLAQAPRITSDNLQATFTGKEQPDQTAYDLVMAHTRKVKNDHEWYQQGRDRKESANRLQARIGFDGRVNNWYHKNPKWIEAESHAVEPEHMKKQYVPLTLYDLQKAIDLGRLDTSRPIDLNALQNAHVVRLATRGPLSTRQYGVMLVDQGADKFTAKNIHLEVQLADDAAIAAVEAAGSTIECAYYDIQSKMALCDPVGYFLKGLPIAKRQLPPMDQDLYMYYNDPKKRGYLCQENDLIQARLNTAEEFGFLHENLELNLYPRKLPNQIFYGLKPGMIVNLAEKQIYESSDAMLNEYNQDSEYYEELDSKIENFYKPRYTETRKVK